jgi:lipopolysaccharide cholinephosphotransferase
MKLLNKLLEVCKKNNLRIFAESGTLLGAVREHGYIPWDDDIDMAMPCEDYDKLREVAIQEFQAPFFFQCGYTDMFPNGLTRLRMDGTSAITYNSIYHNYHQGMFIDIFPLDSIPDNSDDLQNFFKRISETSKIKLYNSHHISFLNLVYDWKVMKMHYLIKKNGLAFYFRKHDELVKLYQNKKCSRFSIISWSINPRNIREKKWYDETIYLPFEDILIPAPKGYDSILSTQYGNYMKPVKAPTEHGTFIALDSEHSYLDYLPELRKIHKWDSWKSRWNTLKRFIRILVNS